VAGERGVLPDQGFAPDGVGGEGDSSEHQETDAGRPTGRDVREVVLPGEDQEGADEREECAAHFPAGERLAEQPDAERERRDGREDRDERPLASVRQVRPDEQRREREGQPAGEHEKAPPVRPREVAVGLRGADDREQDGRAQDHPQEDERERRDGREPPLRDDVHPAPDGGRGEQRESGQSAHACASGALAQVSPTGCRARRFRGGPSCGRPRSARDFLERLEEAVRERRVRHPVG
jgi:hypothetical protein